MSNGVKVGLAISSVVIPVLFPTLLGLAFGDGGLFAGLLVGGAMGLIFAILSLDSDGRVLARMGIIFSSAALIGLLAFVFLARPTQEGGRASMRQDMSPSSREFISETLG